MSKLLPNPLRRIVNESVSAFGEVLRSRLGEKTYQQIESLRQSMAFLRQTSGDQDYVSLQKTLQKLKRLSANARFEYAQSFALMLELMNACENSYRSHEVKKRVSPKIKNPRASITYVLTAHPTESRSPETIWIFHEIQKVLIPIFDREVPSLMGSEKELLKQWLMLALNTSMMRTKKPQVRDEAAYIYSLLLREETLVPFLRARTEFGSISAHSWVGGDKDGHPGVDENTFLQSLQLSRRHLVEFAKSRLRTLEPFLRSSGKKKLSTSLKKIRQDLQSLQKLSSGDGRRIEKFKKGFSHFFKESLGRSGVAHPHLFQIHQLLQCFPALVVPLEFRESSDLLLSSPSGKGLAIARMLKKLSQISRGSNPRFYVHEFIISMANDAEHIRIAARIVKNYLGDIYLPIVPLFEQAEAQEQSVTILKAMLQERHLRKALKTHWNNSLEVMLGYSDSSKERGVLASRLKVAETMYKIESFCAGQKITPIFFHGSGGSVDRGGGPIEEQTSWWPAQALKNYKVTIQGEMIERTLANSDITWSQLAQVAESTSQWEQARSRQWKSNTVLTQFADMVAEVYQAKVADPEFLKAIEEVTPYNSLSLINIGSRPSKRAQKLSVEALRAIPWILCWTQTRILFPVWWGIGSAWEKTSAKDRQVLRKCYEDHPVFRTYIKALGFTLAKVELPVWKVYIFESDLSLKEKERLWNDFIQEYTKTLDFMKVLFKGKSLIYWRPWLQESISLRSPMIHPLNLLQIVAIQSNDANLFRVCVAGISRGMMTTG